MESSRVSFRVAIEFWNHWPGGIRSLWSGRRCQRQQWVKRKQPSCHKENWKSFRAQGVHVEDSTWAQNYADFESRECPLYQDNSETSFTCRVQWAIRCFWLDGNRPCIDHQVKLSAERWAYSILLIPDIAWPEVHPLLRDFTQRPQA